MRLTLVTTPATSDGCGRSTDTTPTGSASCTASCSPTTTELVARIKPGVTPAAVLADAAEAMRARIDATDFSKPSFRTACEEALVFAGHLSHPVGMSVHDVGDYSNRPFEPGLVFSVDPMIWVTDEHLYIRVEDTVVVTEDGIENLTGFVPLAARRRRA